MKTKRIFSYFFSLFFCFHFAQKSKIEEKPKWKYEPNFMVGVDVLSAGVSFFSDRKLYQGFVSSKLKKNLHGIVDVGFEKNVYQKNGYDAEVNGPFLKLGGFYMMMQDQQQELNGFYLGGKLGASFYNQEYKAIPVRGYGGSSSSVSFPSSMQSSYWFEATAGGRVQLFESNFFIDVNVQPKYLVYTTKQEDIKPMIVPGFGKSSGKFNFGFAWSIAYNF